MHQRITNFDGFSPKPIVVVVSCYNNNIFVKKITLNCVGFVGIKHKHCYFFFLNLNLLCKFCYFVVYFLSLKNLTKFTISPWRFEEQQPRYIYSFFLNFFTLWTEFYAWSGVVGLMLRTAKFLLQLINVLLAFP